MQLLQEKKQTQSLIMSAQMQQSIRILQLSSHDLEAFMERAYLENPVLEMEDAPRHAEGDTIAQEIAAAPFTADDAYYVFDSTKESGQQEYAAPIALSLEEELLREVDFAFSDLREKAVAVFLVGSLDHRGYLTVPLAEVARATGAQLTEAENVLTHLQSFDPPGIGARDLAECMRLQAERVGLYEGLLRTVIDRYLPAVAEGRYHDIARAERTSIVAVQSAVDILRTFSPKPGSAYGTANTPYIRPDVRLVIGDGELHVESCTDQLPRLYISPLYRSALRTDAATRDYIAHRLYAARWLLRSIAERHETIRRVAEELVRRQKGFALHGSPLHPLTMQAVADALHLHASTVSRTVTQKYIELPHGIRPLKGFFSTEITSDATGRTSAAQVRAAIHTIIDGEDKHHPYSDARIAELLIDRGLPAARRTVVKYREQLGFPSSTKRRRY